MTTSLYCLLAATGWTMFLLLVLLVWRSVDVLRGVRRLDAFPAGVPHGTDAYWRLNRAHLNCVENLPLFGSVVLVANVAGVTTPRLDLLAVAWLVCRIGQTLTHLASGAPAAVAVRAALYSSQVVLLLGMILTILESR